MVNFFFTDGAGGHLLTFNDFTQWCFGCDYDQRGEAYIYLLVGKTEYKVYTSKDLRQAHPKLPASAVSAYYTAVIKAIFDVAKAENPAYVDIDAIREDVLPAYWEKWQEAGYVDGEMPCDV